MPKKEEEEEVVSDEEGEEDDEEVKPKKEKKEKKDKKDKKEKKEKKSKKEKTEDAGEGEGAEEAEAEPEKEVPKEFPPPADMPAHYRNELLRIKEGGAFEPHTASPPITEAIEVTYCPVDGLPPDFCQYGPSWEKSKPYCIENFPHFYPELAAGANLADAKKGADAALAKEKTKELPGGKKKREKSPAVNIKKLSRGGRKCVTQVMGLESFGVKGDDAAKVFKKKFACGSAFVKGDSGLPDYVEIQGDFEEEVIDVICKEFKQVAKEKCSIGEGGVKKAGKKK